MRSSQPWRANRARIPRSQQARTAALERMGYRVCRVTNDDVARNMDGVLYWLLHELEGRS